MRDLVDIFEQNERRFYGTDEAGQVKCSYCKGQFHPDDTVKVGEQVIRGRYVRNARACIECEPVSNED